MALHVLRMVDDKTYYPNLPYGERLRTAEETTGNDWAQLNNGKPFQRDTVHRFFKRIFPDRCQPPGK